MTAWRLLQGLPVPLGSEHTGRARAPVPALELRKADATLDEGRRPRGA